MGLAAPKKRIKLSHDPNNTAWSNDTQSFGLKMMTAQGWTPGALLGAKDAPHAEFHTAANASHIRVSIKDDNLGLGAKIGSGVGHGECTGLDIFKNILGRLNGQDEEELAVEQRKRDDLRRAIYTERKWGSQRFVSGGFLVGDKIQDLIDGEAKRLKHVQEDTSTSDSDSSSDAAEEAKFVSIEKPKKSKKRKAEAIEKSPEIVAVKSKKSKKKRKLERDTEEKTEIKKIKKSKKDRQSKQEGDVPSDNSKSKRRKNEKRKDKESKKERKEKDKFELEDTEKDSEKNSKRNQQKSNIELATESSKSSTKESSPTIPITASSSGRSTPIMQGRHAVRSRHIAQKRLAHMDVAALNQIFMIKS